jgi:hypothetical protein
MPPSRIAPAGLTEYGRMASQKSVEVHSGALFRKERKLPKRKVTFRIIGIYAVNGGW